MFKALSTFVFCTLLIIVVYYPVVDIDREDQKVYGPNP